MTRITTKQRHLKVLKDFWKLLRSGRDYTTSSMYDETGKKNFLSRSRVGAIVNNYYNSIINAEMIDFVRSQNGMPHEEKLEEFCIEFKVCKREGRLMFRYITENLNKG